MTDNDFTCPQCKGSDKMIEQDYSPRWYIICPSCNKGRVQLAVECGTCSGKGKISPTGYEHPFTALDPSLPVGMTSCEHAGISGLCGEINIPCEQCELSDKPCSDCTNGYRPLTSDEVREFASKCGKSAFILAGKIRWVTDGYYTYKYKGSPVVLIPKEDV